MAVSKEALNLPDHPLVNTLLKLLMVGEPIEKANPLSALKYGRVPPVESFAPGARRITPEELGHSVAGPNLAVGPTGGAYRLLAGGNKKSIISMLRRLNDRSKDVLSIVENEIDPLKKQLAQQEYEELKKEVERISYKLAEFTHFRKGNYHKKLAEARKATGPKKVTPGARHPTGQVTDVDVVLSEGQEVLRRETSHKLLRELFSAAEDGHLEDALKYGEGMATARGIRKGNVIATPNKKLGEVDETDLLQRLQDWEMKRNPEKFRVDLKAIYEGPPTEKAWEGLFKNPDELATWKNHQKEFWGKVDHMVLQEGLRRIRTQLINPEIRKTPATEKMLVEQMKIFEEILSNLFRE